MKKRNEMSVRTLFLMFYLGCSVIVLFQAYYSSGEILRHFFCDSGTFTISDFTVSLVETTGAKPYQQFQTLYPPLANFLFYGMNLLVPESIKRNWASADHWRVAFQIHGSEYDPRLHSVSMTSLKWKRTWQTI